MRTRLLMAMTAVAASTAGCGADGTTVVTSTVTVSVPVGVAAPSTVSAPAQAAVLGEPQTTPIGVKAIPISLENPTARQPDPSFAKYGAAGPWILLDAELCAGTKPLTKTGYGFSLIDADNREYKSYDNTAQPFKPTMGGGSGELAPGECVRGFVNFEQPAGVQLVALRWDYPGGGGPLRWKLP